jgi:phosphopantothenate synthetase
VLLHPTLVVVVVQDQAVAEEEVLAVVVVVAVVDHPVVEVEAEAAAVVEDMAVKLVRFSDGYIHINSVLKTASINFDCISKHFFYTSANALERLFLFC